MVASKQTRLKLRKGFHKAPLSYRVLMVSQFTEKDMKEVAKGLLHAVTPKKAEDLLPRPGKPSSWSVKQISLVGDSNVIALRFKGLEVAAYWRRQTSEVIPAPEDPVPEGVLENADDVWVRFDLLYKSARQLTQAVSQDITDLKGENVRLQTSVDALTQMSSPILQKRIKNLEGTIAENASTITSLKSKVKALEAKLKAYMRRM